MEGGLEAGDGSRAGLAVQKEWSKKMEISEGARIIVDHWIQVKRGETVLFITDETHVEEGMEIRKYAAAYGGVVILVVIPQEAAQDGIITDKMTELFCKVDIIVGATEHSLITTKAVKSAIAKGARFLSLPLSSNTGRSILESDFLSMEPAQSAKLAKGLVDCLNQADTIRATTALGTDITFGKAGRKAAFFNGLADLRSCIGSSSFEAYVPIVEDATEGVVILDGSLGYLGAAKDHTRLEFQQGYLRKIESTLDGLRLKEYIDGFQDWEMYCACEFGVGLNYFAQCNGSSYIEDESSYGTFHIGMGRNIALGGNHDAKGHFDLVIKNPDIYADGKQVIRDGKIIV